MKQFVVFALSLFLLSCSSNSNFMTDASFLEGNWKREYNGIVQLEEWNKTETGFSGKNLFVSNDTNVMNTYTIELIGSNWVYTKSVTETELSFSFNLLSSNSDSLVFQNSENTWPQTITYKKINDNKMELIVDGQDGTMHKNAALTFIK